MKPLRGIVLATSLIALIFSAVVYSACTKDKCNNVVCQNGGACDGGNCTCLPGFEGNRCQTYSRDKFVYTFNGGDTCSSNDLQYNQYPIKFLSVIANPRNISMHNFLGNVDDSAMCTMQSVDSFSFLGSNNSTTYSGYGTLHNDTLKMIYHVQHDTTSYDCAYKGGIYL